MSQHNTAMIYVETFTMKNQDGRISAICGELHYPGTDSSCVSVLGTNDCTLAAVAETARLLESLKARGKNPMEIQVKVYTTNNQLIWGWKDFQDASPQKHKQQWKRLINISKCYQSVEIEGAGILSRTVKEKAKFLLLRRLKNNEK